MFAKIALSIAALLAGGLLFLASGLVYSASSNFVAAFQIGLVLLTLGAIWFAWKGKFALTAVAMGLMLVLFWWLRS